MRASDPNNPSLVKAKQTELMHDVCDCNSVLAQKLFKRSSIGNAKRTQRFRGVSTVFMLERGRDQTKKVLDGVSSVHIVVQPLFHLHKHTIDRTNEVTYGVFGRCDGMNDVFLQRVFPTANPPIGFFKFDKGPACCKISNAADVIPESCNCGTACFRVAGQGWRVGYEYP